MALRLFFLIVTIVCTSAALAQNTAADSLHRLVYSAPSDTNKVILLNELVATLREKDNNRALSFAHDAVDLADSLRFKKGLAAALENLGWILYRKGDYSRSLETSTRALKVSEECADLSLVARCLINIAAIHYEQKQFDKAIENFRNAYEIAERTGDRQTMARCYNNIAYTYLGLEEADSSFAFAVQALRMSDETGDHYMSAFALRTLGDIELMRGNNSGALKLFSQCLDISVKQDNTFLKASVLHRLGKTHNLLGNTQKAIAFLSENIAIGERFGFKDELERAYKMASEIYYHQGDLAVAYDYQLKYINLHDSLYNQRSSEQIALMQIRFDTELKQAQIELLIREDALKAGEIRSQRGWIYFYVACLALFVALATVFFHHNRNNRRGRQLLQEKNREIERQTHELRNLNAAKDKLFSIISHDLRSPVASLKALMELISISGMSQEEFSHLTQSLKRNLDSVYDDLDNLLLWAQSQLNGLQATPEEIDLRELADQKIQVFRETAARKQITITNAIKPDSRVHADRNHVSLIFRNLLANAVKFNHPGGSIDLSSKQTSTHVEVSISDSGVGIEREDLDKLFNAETHFTRPGTQKEKGAGLGLLLTKEFIEVNQGSIWVASELQKGTTFTFALRTAKIQELV